MGGADGAARAGTGRTAAGALLLLALCAVSVWPSLAGGFLWDDDAVTDNPHLSGWSGLVALWTHRPGIPHEEHWWPVTYTSFWLERPLWGDWAPGYRAANVLLHALACLLLWRLLARLAAPGALLAAALFAVHPVHVESVAWVIERKDVLSGALALGCAVVLLAPRDGPRAARVAAACALLAAACLAKSAVVPLPAALAAAAWWRGTLRRDARALAALGAVAVALGALDLALTRAAAPVADLARPLAERVGIAGRALTWYATSLALPAGRSPVPARFAAELPRLLPHAAAWVALLAGLFAARRRVGRAPFAALAGYVALLLPVAGLVPFSWQRHSFVADRFQYLASGLPLALAAALLARAGGGLPRAARLAGAALLVGTLAATSFDYARAFRDPGAHARRVVAASPSAWSGWFELGRVRASEGDPEGALAAYDRSLALRGDHAATWDNRGGVLWTLGRREEAERGFLRALELAPGLATAHANLGVALAARGELAEAEERLRRAAALAPRSAETRANLGLVLAKAERLDEAAVELRAALALDAGNALARRTLDTLLELRPDLGR